MTMKILETFLVLGLFVLLGSCSSCGDFFGQPSKETMQVRATEAFPRLDISAGQEFEVEYWINRTYSVPAPGEQTRLVKTLAGWKPYAEVDPGERDDFPHIWVVVQDDGP